MEPIQGAMSQLSDYILEDVKGVPRRWAYVTGSKFLDAAIIRKRLWDESDADDSELKEGRSQIWTQEALEWVINEASRQTGVPDAFKVKNTILVDISVLGPYIKVSDAAAYLTDDYNPFPVNTTVQVDIPWQPRYSRGVEFDTKREFEVQVDSDGRFDLVSFIEGLYVPSEFKDGRWPIATKDAMFKIFQAVERSEDVPKTVADWDILARAWCHTAGCREKDGMSVEQRMDVGQAREYGLDVHGLPSGPAVRIFLFRIMKAVNALKGVPRGTTFPSAASVPEFVVLQTGNHFGAFQGRSKIAVVVEGILKAAGVPFVNGPGGHVREKTKNKWLGLRQPLSSWKPSWVVSVEISQVSHSSIARALAINTFLGWMRPGRNCTPHREAFEHLRVGIDAVISKWQSDKGVMHAYPASFPRQPSGENETGWYESFNMVQILTELLKRDNRSLFNSLRGYGIHNSVMTLRLPVDSLPSGAVIPILGKERISNVRLSQPSCGYITVQIRL